MSLTEPSAFEKLLIKFGTWPIAVRIAVGLGVVLLVVGIILFGVAKFDNWKFDRKIDKARANVNAALADVNVAKQVVANDRVNEVLAVEDVKRAANDAVAASQASDAAKTVANQAVANYAAARNANLPVGTTEQDIHNALDALDK